MKIAFLHHKSLLHLQCNYENTENMFICLSILTIAEVGDKINLKDEDAIKKWLISKDISIHKTGKFRFVYEIDVDCAIDKIRVLELRKQYPDDWIGLYKRISKDSAVYEMVVHNLQGEISTKPTTKVKPNNKTENELYKKYAK